uniref:NADH-ubiquinone oxidoreductase chain 3 n=1 Tax=Cis micans TaxID=577917 RepID=A0A343C4I6_9CUCU|nr:NADH dehydrogenase subunit 3 [Cis micans]
MVLTMTMALMVSLIIIIMTTVLNLTSMKKSMDREKSSPFECGFDPKSSARLPFSLHFFMIAMIFLIFDIEIALLFPMNMSIKSSNPSLYTTTMIIMIMILIIGLLHEWYQGALNWKK